MKRRAFHDHRGREVPLCDETALPPGTDARIRQVVWMAARSRPHRLAVRLAVMTLCIVGSRLVFLYLRGSSSRLEMLGSAVTVLVVIGLLVAYARMTGGFADRRAAKLCLSRRLCPSCGYTLDGLTPEADGCRVCPECGAAWKVAEYN